MKKYVVIAGSRHYCDYEEACIYIDRCLMDISEECEIIILSGCAKGADLLGERYARERGYETEKFPADWKTYKKGAGPIRNKLMAEKGDMVICFWDGESKGTKSMIELAKKLKKPLYIKYIISK